MIFYEPARLDRSVLAHDPFKAIVAPRPIGWGAVDTDRPRAGSHRS